MSDFLDLSDLIEAGEREIAKRRSPRSRSSSYKSARAEDRRYPALPADAKPDALILPIYEKTCASCGSSTRSPGKNLLVRFGTICPVYNGPSSLLSTLPREVAVYHETVPFCENCFQGKISLESPPVDRLDPVLYPHAVRFSPVDAPTGTGKC